MRTYIEITPFDGVHGGGCHWWVVMPTGIGAGGCRGSVFEAVAAGFNAARECSKAKTFRVVVL